MFEFPQELWYKIKSYEYQLTHSHIIKQIIKDVCYNAYMPYCTSLHQYKGGDKLYEYMKRYQNTWQPYFKESKMEKLCYKYDSQAKKDYN